MSPNLKFKRRSWEPPRLRGVGPKSFQSVRGSASPSAAWEHSRAILSPGPSAQKLPHSRLLVSVGQASPDAVFVAGNTRRGICPSSSGFGCSVIRSIYSSPSQRELPWARHNAVSHI